MQTALSVTAFQQRVLEVPEEINLAILGGRGGGKSMAKALLALRYGEQYRELARMMYVRRSYAGLRDFEENTRTLFGMAYGPSARYSGNEHIWRLPTGAYFELQQIETHSDLNKLQGRSFGLIFIDECGQYASAELPDLVRANLRGPKGIPTRMVVGANPGGVGQTWLAKRYVLGREPWKAFKDEHGSWWMYCPSTLVDNPHLDQVAYRRELEAGCAADPELLKAWLEGSFTSQTGSYFGLCLDEQRSGVGPFKTGVLPKTNGKAWDVWLAHDFGSSAPSCTFIMTQSPGGEFAGQYYPRDSIVILAEYAVHRRDSYAHGLGWTAAKTADALAAWCSEWGVKPRGVADDACFARTGHATSIADEFAAAGVTFEPAKKGDRVSGWQLMRRLLADAGKPDVPGLYVSRACDYFWSTVPFLARDQKRIEDVDSSGPDHAADCVRYGLLRVKNTVTISPLRL